MRSTTKRLATLSGLLALAAGGAYVIAPRALEGIAEREVLAALDDQGLDAEVGKFTLVSPSHARLEDLCIAALPPYEAHDALCVDRLDVWFERDGLTSTDVEVTSVRVEGGFVDLSADFGSLDEIAARYAQHFGGDDDADDAEGSGDAPSSAGGPDGPVEVPAVEVSGFEIRLDGQDVPVTTLTVDQLGVTQAGTATTVEGTLALAGIEAPTGVTAGGLSQIEVQLELDPALEPVRASARFAEPIVADAVLVDGPEGTSVALGGVSLLWPYTLELAAMEVRSEAQDEPLVSVDRLAIQVEDWTTNVDDLYLARTEIDGARVHIEVDAAGHPLALPGAEPVERDATGTPPSAPTTAAGYGDRDWWNQVPWQIALSDVAVTVDAPAGRVLQITDLEGDYALRILNMQLDAQLSASVAVADAPAQPWSAEVTWSHGFGRLLEGHIEVPSLDLGALARAGERVGGALPVDGTVGLTLDASGTTTGQLSLEAGITATRLELQHGLLQQPLRLDDLAWEMGLEAHDQGQGAVVEVTRGALTLNGAQVSMTPTLHGVRFDPVSLERIDVAVEVPDQPAQALFDAIPRSLVGPLGGTVLDGEYGLTLAFPIRFEQDEEGALAVTIDEPTAREIRDTDLVLVSLPHAVDVGRLNGPMSFTFTGTDETLPRDLEIPGIASAATTEGWTPLDRIAYPLVATQLYREDGSFFRNEGINWYQLRRVLAQAIEERALGRGASTISMQLVKNVFLSHERSIERKLQELFLTYWMTRLVPKERILEVYLNVIEWGPGINGVTEAADYYFSKPPSELATAEAVWLSAITPAPLRRARQRATGVPDWMWREVQRLIEGLEGRGMLSADEAAAGSRVRPRFVIDGVPAPQVDGEGEPDEPDMIPTPSPDGMGLLPPPGGPGGVLPPPSSAGGVLPPPRFERESARLTNRDRVQGLAERRRDVRGAGPSPRP